MKLLYTPAAKKIGPVEPEIMGRPRGLRLRLYRTYIINEVIVHPCGNPI